MTQDISHTDAFETAPRVTTDLLEIHHVTHYRYDRPVEFGLHRGMFRPHDSHDLRLLSIEIKSTPQAAMYYQHDVFSNSVTVFEYSMPAQELTITATMQVLRSSIAGAYFPVAPHARTYPFDYGTEQRPDLAPCSAPEYDDPRGLAKDWAQSIAAQANHDTFEILKLMNSTIHQTLSYERREEAGVQSPFDTLSMGRGSCRDYAVLMLEAARHLGFAARFVTGYLYDPLSDVGGVMQGAGATHAWVQVFLPGAGWIEFDPTNGLISSGNLIRTGVARTPNQAAPLRGSYNGPSEAFLEMDVRVDVRALAPTLGD